MRKISASVEAKLLEIAQKFGNGHVDIGFMDSQEAVHAYWAEFGHKGRFPAPPRPFFRGMIAKESPAWPGDITQALRAAGGDGARALALMGEEVQGQLMQSINDFTTPALSPTTLRLRKVFGNSPEKIRARDVVQAQRDVKAGKPLASGTQAKPLQWTGQMIQHVTYRVKS